MSYQLVIAEKPSVARSIAAVIGATDRQEGYLQGMGWYYVTLAVDGKICTHLETGLAHDIASGKVSDTPTREDYFTAGALKEDQVDYVMNNVGFSSTSDLYSLPLHDDVRERAERTLAEREAQAAPPTVEPTPEGISAELYDLMCAYDPEFMKDYANREDQIGGTIREIQTVGPTSFELVIVGMGFFLLSAEIIIAARAIGCRRLCKRATVPAL